MSEMNTFTENDENDSENDESFDFEELMNDINSENNNDETDKKEDESEGFEFGDLF